MATDRLSLSKILSYINQEVHIAPLVTFRIVFGLVMSFAAIRFMAKGWVQDLYVTPKFYFFYEGFEWIKPLDETGMYAIFCIMAVSAFLIGIGLFYRVNVLIYFLSFTYVELIDKTTYLNHYYFVSLVAFLLLLVPANAAYSVDVKLFPKLKRLYVPRWTIGVFKLQLGMVYFFAGIAKINHDWLFRAMPLKIWFAPFIQNEWLGWFFSIKIVPYLFSWCGMLYDVFIPFLLLWKRTRIWAYLTVIFFHVVTWWMFPIGIFPWVMIGSTLIFFSTEWHQKIQAWVFGVENSELRVQNSEYRIENSEVNRSKWSPTIIVLAVFFFIQVLMPMRYLAYPGKLFWTEEGFRFSWRVMLIEKVGTTIFTVKDLQDGREWEVHNLDFLTPLQEIMMSTQPDMILQFAHYLGEEYKRKENIDEVGVFVNSRVALNGYRNRPFIDSSVNLMLEQNDWKHKSWILPFDGENKEVK